jgi:hypothetical protein
VIEVLGNLTIETRLQMQLIGSKHLVILTVITAIYKYSGKRGIEINE